MATKCGLELANVKKVLEDIGIEEDVVAEHLATLQKKGAKVDENGVPILSDKARQRIFDNIEAELKQENARRMIRNQFKGEAPKTTEEFTARISGSIRNIFNGATSLYQENTNQAMRVLLSYLDNLIDESTDVIGASGKTYTKEVAKRAKRFIINAVEKNDDSEFMELMSTIKRELGAENAEQALLIALKGVHKRLPMLPELDVITNLFKKYDNKMIELGQAQSKHIRALRGHVIPLNISVDSVVKSVKRGDFKKIFKDLVDIDAVYGKNAEKIDEILDKYIDDLTTKYRSNVADSYRNVELPQTRTLKFKDDAAEAKFFTTFVDMKDEGILSKAFNHRINAYGKIPLNTILTDNPLEFARLAREEAVSLSEKYKKPLSKKELDNVVEFTKNQISNLKRIGITDETTDLITENASILSQATSLALTPLSFVRDYAWDRTFVPAIQRALLTDQSLLSSTFKTFVGLANGIKKEAFYSSRESANARAIMEALGWSVELDVGLQKQSVFVRTKQGKGKLAAVKRGIEWAGGKMTAWNGSNLAHKASRLDNFLEAGSYVSRLLKDNWDEGFEPLKDIFRSHGLERKEWELMRELPEIFDEWNGAKVSFGVDITKITDDWVKNNKAALGKIKRKGETYRGAADRLVLGYKLGFNEFMERTTAIASYAGDLGGGDVAYTRGILQHLFKFGNTTTTQFLNLQRSIRNSKRLNANLVSQFGWSQARHDFKNHWKATAGLAVAATGSMITIDWTKDFINGEPLRPITSDYIAGAVFATGSFGFAVDKAASVAQYGLDAPVSKVFETPLRLGQAILEEDADEKAYRLNKALDGVPFANWPHFRRIKKQMVEKATGGDVEDSALYKRRQKRRQKDSLKEFLEE